MNKITIGDFEYDIKDFRLACAALVLISKDSFITGYQARFIDQIPVHIGRLIDKDLDIMSSKTSSFTLEEIHHYLNDLAEHYNLPPIPAYPLTDRTIEVIQRHDELVAETNALMDQLQGLLDIEDQLLSPSQEDNEPRPV